MILCFWYTRKSLVPVHVFSHIRKTYRVQWVLLKGGGDEPPQLRPKSGSEASSTMGKGKVAQKGKTRKRPEASEDSEAGKIAVSEVAGWVPLDRVEHAKCVKNRKGTPTMLILSQHRN